jgi:hypothetical protein
MLTDPGWSPSRYSQTQTAHRHRQNMSQAFHANSESPSTWLKNALFVEVASNKPVGKLSLW